MRLGVLARAEVHRRDAERREARHVGPRLLRLDRDHAAVAQGDHQRMLGERRRGGREIGEAHLGAPADERLDVALRLLERRVGRETGGSSSARSDRGRCCGRDRPAPVVALVTVRYTRPSSTLRAARAGRARSRTRPPSGSRSRLATAARCARCAPRTSPSAWIEPVAPSCSLLSDRLEAHREIDRAELGVLLEHRAELVLGEGPFLARVEDQREIAAQSGCDAALERDRASRASPDFMSAAPGAEERIALDARRPVVLGAHHVEVPDERDLAGPCVPRVERGTTSESP